MAKLNYSLPGNTSCSCEGNTFAVPVYTRLRFWAIQRFSSSAVDWTAMSNTTVLEFHCGQDWVIEQYSGSGCPLWTELCYWAIQLLFWSCIVNCTAYWVTQSFWCSILDWTALLSNTAVLGFHSGQNSVIGQRSVSGVPLCALLRYWTIQRIWSSTVDWNALLSNTEFPKFRLGLDCVIE